MLPLAGSDPGGSDAKRNPSALIFFSKTAAQNRAAVLLFLPSDHQNQTDDGYDQEKDTGNPRDKRAAYGRQIQQKIDKQVGDHMKEHGSQQRVLDLANQRQSKSKHRRIDKLHQIPVKQPE